MTFKFDPDDHESINPNPDRFMTLHEVMCLQAGDLDEAVTVADSPSYLEDMYEEEPRWNHGGQKGKFWEKVCQVATILVESDEWPFAPINVWGDTLMDGHHRSNAAMLVGWDKPIPVY